MANTNTTRQRITWQRGQQSEFRFAFLKSDSSPIPVLDPSRYPSYAIYSPGGIQVVNGVATPFGDPGSYRVLWTVPVDADLSNDTQSWMIQVTFLDTKKKQYQTSYDFNVVEKQITSQENRDLVLLGVEKAPFRITWRGDNVPVSIRLVAYDSLAPDNVATAPIPVSVTPSGPLFDGDSVSYYYDVPPNILTPGSYTFLWTIQETVSAPTEIEYQQLSVISRKVLAFIPQVKFITNRFQAAFHLPNYISDADYAEGLKHGLDFINQWHPISFYSFDDMIGSRSATSPLTTFWLMASAWYVLHSQHLTELNMSFQFSGATTSLDFDRTGGIESALGRLREEMSQNLTPAKISFKYMSQGIGQLGVRPAQLRSYQNRVFLIEQSSGMSGTSQLWNMMSTIGIAP